MRFEDTSKEQVHLLASLLSQPDFEPYGIYAEKVFCIEQQLDRGILRPDFLHRLVQPPQSHYTPLCGLHKILNAKIVHRIFVLVATEVGVRLNSLVVAGRDVVGPEIWDRTILNLRSLHGAWLHPEVFWDTFGKTLDVPKGGHSKTDYMTKWSQEESKCEACILTRIGGDLETVLDLQTVIKSRTHTRSVKRYHEPRLNKVIDGWLLIWKLHYRSDEWDDKLGRSRKNASELKDVRRELAREKRSRREERKIQSQSGQKRTRVKVSAPIIEHQRQRPNADDSVGSKETIDIYLSSGDNKNDHKSGTAATDEEDDDMGIRQTVYAAENEIIDCYAALISTPFLPNMDSSDHQKRASKLSRHRMTMITHVEQPTWPTIAKSRTDQGLTRSQSTRNKRTSTYSESIYSQNPTVVEETRPERLGKFTENLNRSYSVQERRSSDNSWVTASVAPSQTTQITTGKKTETRRARQAAHKFDTISEENLMSHTRPARQSKGPISPVNDHDRRKRAAESKANIRSGFDSPVSPISLDSMDFFRPLPRDRSLSDDRRARSQSQKHSKRPSDNLKHRSGSLSRIQLDSGSPKTGARLSKPFDTPAVEHSALLGSVKHLRDEK